MRRHVESNRQSRDAWDRYAPHRARITALTMESLAPGDRLCVLGAGNVNDLDLAEVLRVAAQVDLADIDGAAMSAGVRRQGLDGDPRISRHEHDLSGDGVPGAFDVVLSAGVLTQLIEPGAAVEDTLALRDRHLAEMTRLGRRAVLVTDVVSTSTAPSLLGLAEDEMEPAMAALVAAGNFFTGTNPYRIAAVLEDGGAAGDVTLHDPWLWAVTPDRRHLTYAISWRRRQR